MKDPSKTGRAQNREFASLRQRIAELEQAQSQNMQMEERLRGSEQRLRGIIENAQSGYFFIDRDGIYRQVNDAWLRMHKYQSPNEIIGRHFSVSQVDVDLGKAQHIVEGLLAGDPVPTGEFSRRCKDGSIGYHTFSATPVFSNREVIGLEGFLTDITEHKKALDARRASEGRFRSLLDDSLDAILLTVPTKQIISANRAAQSLLGMTEEEICRAGHTGIAVQDEALARAVEEREKTGKWRGTLTFRRKDGSTFPVEASSNAFESPDGRVMTTVIFRDITERKRVDDELRLHSEILTRMADGVILIRAKDGGIIYTNPRLESMFGYGSGELVGRHVSALNAPRGGSPEEVAQKIMEVLEQAGEWNGEICNVKKDGTLFWCHAHVSTFEHFVHGSVWISNQEDITERKEAELALRESEERFRLFMDNSPTIAWIKDEQGRYVYLSRTFEERFGVRGKDWIGKTDAAFWPPEIAENFRMNDLAVLENGHPREITEQTVNPDGSRGDWLISKFPFRAAGNLYVAGIGLDITERKKVEEEVRFLSQVVEQSTDSVICSDAEFRIIYMNRSAEKLFGWSKEELLGKTPDIFNAEPAADEIQKKIYTSLLSGKAYLGEALNRRKDGSTFYCQFLVSPLFDIDGRLMGSIGSQRDVTDRKKAQDELATHRERLEELVKERTKDLENKTQILEELNAATRALLRQREEDRKELEERFVANMKNLILPYAEKMKRTRLDERQLSYLGIMETHLNEIMSPLMRTMQQHNFTPTESQVASLIKDGRSTKEIAQIMGVASSSIDTHRKSIRKKMGLSNKKVNLESHLRSLGL
jgi:PAS domain S-box-containing protein